MMAWLRKNVWEMIWGLIMWALILGLVIYFGAVY